MIDKEKCCGCSACMNICPKNCIKMVPDKEGFLYPRIDKNICVSCGLCDSVCPALKKGIKQNDVRAYACINKDDEIKLASSSGGVFSLFAEEVLKNGGVVFGAVFDENFKVIHSYIESTVDLCRLRGSKYVQSDMQECFSEAKKFVVSGREVLFSGTSCQIAGLKNYLGKDYDNLLCIDVICHGVPSPLVFEKYLSQRKEEAKETVKGIFFRDKEKGWIDFSLKIDFASKKYSKKVSEDEYLQGFVSSLYLRPSCYDCNCKDFTCGSDISLADFWGIKNISPDFFDKNGVSMVLVNTLTGKEAFDKIKEKILVREEKVEDCIKCNPAIVRSATENKRRRRFFKQIKSQDICTTIKKSITPNIINKINMKVYRIIRMCSGDKK